ncbi:MAG: riboflavin synthase [Acidobacteriaceae bacterium]
MFTGIIEQTGTVRTVQRRGREATRITVDTPLSAKLRLGDSIAVNGTCLTAVEITAASFAADLLEETLKRTTLGGFAPGLRVNLELPTPLGAPLGGHIVQGHVEGCGTVQALTLEQGSSNTWRFALALPPEIMRHVIDKGSIAIDGISLTVAKITEQGIELSIIPHTYEVTNISTLKPGDRVNIETDPLAKYAARSAPQKASTPLTVRGLLQRGY